MKLKIIKWILKIFLKIPPRDFEKTIEATLRILSDPPLKNADAILVFGRARGDDNEVFFRHIASLSSNFQFVVLNGSKGEALGKSTPGESWEGGEIFSNRLEQQGVTKEKHLFIPPAGHTGQEAHGFVSMIKEKGWSKVTIVAWPHQLLRCLAALLIEMKRQDVVDVIVTCSHPIQAGSWLALTAGSQGENNIPRKKHILLEYSRINKYAGTGCATIDEVLFYLDERDLVLTK